MDEQAYCVKTAESVKCVLRRSITEKGFKNVNVDFFVNDFLRFFDFHIEVLLAGKNFDPYEVKYPRNWVESVKERFLPKWLLKKYPVKYVRHTIHGSLIYRDFKPDKFYGRHIENIAVCVTGCE